MADRPYIAPAPKPPGRRPTPQGVRAMLGEFARRGVREVSLPDLVAVIRRETGCSRATAYRAVGDAIEAGTIRPMSEAS